MNKLFATWLVGILAVIFLLPVVVLLYAILMGYAPNQFQALVGGILTVFGIFTLIIGCPIVSEMRET